MENLEKLLDDIEKFECNSFIEDFPDSLNDFLKHVAQTGDPVFPWIKVKNVIRHKLVLVMSAFFQVYGLGDGKTTNEDPISDPQLIAYNHSTFKILEQFDTFTGAPFTIQRICEMLLDPRKHYRNPDKFIRGMEKNVLVVSCVSPGHVRQPDTSQDSILNGMIEDVALHLGVNSQENVCDSGMTNNSDHANDVTANGLVEDTCSSSSSSGSSSASSSPSPEDDPDGAAPSAKRPKLSLEEGQSPPPPLSCPRRAFEVPSCSTTEAAKESEKSGQVDTSESPVVHRPEVLSEEIDVGEKYIQNKHSPGSPDSAQDCDKNLVEMENETDDNSEAAATLRETIAESSTEEPGGSETCDSSACDSTSSQPPQQAVDNNEASSIEFPIGDSTATSAENAPVPPSMSECEAREAVERDLTETQTRVISTSDADDKRGKPETAAGESPCSSSLL